MNKGNLNCNVTNCAHNSENKCRVGHIDINGEKALKKIGTTCMTFLDRVDSGMINSVTDYHNTDAGDIRCAAGNCIHNKNKRCYANEVNICMDGGYCDTFKCK